MIGFYGLAPTAVVPGALPRSIRTGQPPDPLTELCPNQSIGHGVRIELRPNDSSVVGWFLFRNTKLQTLIERLKMLDK
jgi:hypothetical protein